MQMPPSIACVPVAEWVGNGPEKNEIGIQLCNDLRPAATTSGGSLRLATPGHDLHRAPRYRPVELRCLSPRGTAAQAPAVVVLRARECQGLLERRSPTRRITGASKVSQCVSAGGCGTWPGSPWEMLSRCYPMLADLSRFRSWLGSYLQRNISIHPLLSPFVSTSPPETLSCPLPRLSSVATHLISAAQPGARVVGEEDEREAWRGDRDLARVGGRVAGDGLEREVACEPTVGSFHLAHRLRGM